MAIANKINNTGSSFTPKLITKEEMLKMQQRYAINTFEKAPQEFYNMAFDKMMKTLANLQIVVDPDPEKPAAQRSQENPGVSYA